MADLHGEQPGHGGAGVPPRLCRRLSQEAGGSVSVLRWLWGYVVAVWEATPNPGPQAEGHAGEPGPGEWQEGA